MCICYACCVLRLSYLALLFDENAGRGLPTVRLRFPIASSVPVHQLWQHSSAFDANAVHICGIVAALETYTLATRLAFMPQFLLRITLWAKAFNMGHQCAKSQSVPNFPSVYEHDRLSGTFNSGVAAVRQPYRRCERRRWTCSSLVAGDV